MYLDRCAVCETTGAQLTLQPSRSTLVFGGFPDRYELRCAACERKVADSMQRTLDSQLGKLEKDEGAWRRGVLIRIEPQPPPRFCSGDVAAITNGTLWAFSSIDYGNPEPKAAWPPGNKEGLTPPSKQARPVLQDGVWYWEA